MPNTSTGIEELKPMDDWIDVESYFDNANTKALNTIFAVVGPNEFKLISTCKSAKDAWENLQTVYEGTSTVRLSKLQVLTT
jgi:hypothetical protein